MFTRYLSAVASSTFMTLGLVYVMQFLISLDAGTAPEPRPRMILDLVTVRPDEPVKPRERNLPDRKKLTKTESPPPRIDPRYQGPVVHVSGPSPLPPTRQHYSSLPAQSDNPLVAIVRVEPAYPVGLQARGVEGFVVVEFDVLANGQVANVVVVETSHGGFNKAAIKAAQRFKYKARVVDGVPQVTTGLRNKFTFRMTD